MRPGSSTTKQRIIFAALIMAGIAALAVGVFKGDPETIHRFAAQI